MPFEGLITKTPFLLITDPSFDTGWLDVEGWNHIGIQATTTLSARIRVFGHLSKSKPDLSDLGFLVANFDNSGYISFHDPVLWLRIMVEDNQGTVSCHLLGTHY